MRIHFGRGIIWAIARRKFFLHEKEENPMSEKHKAERNVSLENESLCHLRDLVILYTWWWAMYGTRLCHERRQAPNISARCNGTEIRRHFASRTCVELSLQKKIEFGGWKRELVMGIMG